VKVDSTDVDIKSSGESVSVKAGEELPPVPEGLAKSGALKYADDAEISGQYISVDGDGIVLKGNGDYVLADSYIVAGKNAVVVSDNATVVMKNCVIRGGQAAILIDGNGTVEASGNVISGKIKKLGNADFVDKGSNVLQ